MKYEISWFAPGSLSSCPVQATHTLDLCAKHLYREKLRAKHLMSVEKYDELTEWSRYFH